MKVKKFVIGIIFITIMCSIFFVFSEESSNKAISNSNNDIHECQCEEDTNTNDLLSSEKAWECPEC